MICVPFFIFASYCLSPVKKSNTNQNGTVAGFPVPWAASQSRKAGSIITYAALITACGKCEEWRQVPSLWLVSSNKKSIFLEENGGCNQQKMGMNQPKWIFEQILSDLTATFWLRFGNSSQNHPSGVKTFSVNH